MGIKKILIGVAVLAALLASPLYAQIPGLINFQGKLLDTSNNPKNGVFSMTFSIYNVATGGSALWTETQPSVPVTNGVFSVQLGAVTAIPQSVFVSSPTYLEVDIAGQTGSPRQELVTSPYSFSSGQADTATVALTAENLVPGNPNYIQNTQTLQSGAVFYVSSATVGGPFVATGTVTLGGTAGVHDVSVNSNLAIGGDLTANGAGPHVFTGNILVGGNAQINGGNLNDSGGTSRIVLGDPLTINAPNIGIAVPNGQPGVMFSTSVFFNGTPNGDNYIAYPFTAQNTITFGNAVILQGGGVAAAATNNSALSAGFAVTSASAGQTVWVAATGIFGEAVSNGTVNIGARVCTSNTLGAVQSCTSAGAPIGKAITGTTGAGQTFSVLIWQGN